MMGTPDGTVRWFGSVLCSGLIFAAVLLSAGCLGASSDGAGADGSPGGTPGVDGSPGGAPGVDSSPGAGYSDPGSVSGSGRPAGRKLTLSGVDTLVVAGNFIVHVKIGEPEQVTMGMDHDLPDLVDATVTGSQLHLGLRPGASVWGAPPTADVTVRHLGRLTVSGATKAVLDSTVTGKTLHLEAYGVSQITGPVRADAAVVSATGASRLVLSGNVGRLNLQGMGTCDLQLSDLSIQDLDADVTGASQAVVTVRGTLAAEANGASTLRYSGNPRITRQETTGVALITAVQ
ncbi:MAG TPA: DUF2807 domain-containing protein [Pseudonocardiaceae bacterium]